MTGGNPWDANEGKYDRPSSSTPNPPKPARVKDRPALSEEQELYAYRGIEPVRDPAETSEGRPESTGQEPGSTDTTERLQLSLTPEGRADTSEQAYAPAGCDGPSDTDVATVAPERLKRVEPHEHALLRSYVERRERIEDDMADLRADRSELMKEVKSSGFDRDIFEMIIRRRKLDRSIRENIDTLVELYEEALGMRDGSGEARPLDVARDAALTSVGPSPAGKKKPSAKDLAIAEAVGWSGSRMRH